MGKALSSRYSARGRSFFLLFSHTTKKIPAVGVSSAGGFRAFPVSRGPSGGSAASCHVGFRRGMSPWCFLGFSGCWRAGGRLPKARRGRVYCEIPLLLLEVSFIRKKQHRSSTNLWPASVLDNSAPPPANTRTPTRVNRCCRPSCCPRRHRAAARRTGSARRAAPAPAAARRRPRRAYPRTPTFPRRCRAGRRSARRSW